MARTRSITDQQILDAARAVFLDKGYSATTSEIARHAGISEGTIFRRFASKEELFVAAMGLDDEPEWFELCSTLVGVGEVRANLRRIVDAIHTFFVEHVPRMIGAIGSPIDVAAIMRGVENPPPLRGHRKLAEYLRAEAELGRLPMPRNIDVVTRVILGTIHLHAFSGLVGLNERIGLSSDRVIEGIVDIVLQTLDVAAADDEERK